MQAVDPDFQLNGIVVYTFENLTLTKGPFQIDRESGEIRVRSGMEGRLDRETIPSYDVSTKMKACSCIFAWPRNLIWLEGWFACMIAKPSNFCVCS